MFLCLIVSSGTMIKQTFLQEVIVRVKWNSMYQPQSIFNKFIILSSSPFFRWHDWGSEKLYEVHSHSHTVQIHVFYSIISYFIQRLRKNKMKQKSLKRKKTVKCWEDKFMACIYPLFPDVPENHSPGSKCNWTWHMSWNLFVIPAP